MYCGEVTMLIAKQTLPYIRSNMKMKMGNRMVTPLFLLILNHLFVVISNPIRYDEGWFFKYKSGEFVIVSVWHHLHKRACEICLYPMGKEP